MSQKDARSMTDLTLEMTLVYSVVYLVSRCGQSTWKPQWAYRRDFHEELYGRCGEGILSRAAEAVQARGLTRLS